MTEETVNTLESPGEFDALVKLRPDEPYFLLLGRDRSAPDLVQQWADGNRRKAFREHNEGLIDEAKFEAELRQSTDAEKIGWAMKSYKAGQDKDAATGQLPLAPTYTGHVMPEETERRDREQRSRARAVAALHNAVAELSDAGATFRDIGEVDALATCTGTIDVLRTVAEALAPKRPGIEKAAA